MKKSALIAMTLSAFAVLTFEAQALNQGDCPKEFTCENLKLLKGCSVNDWAGSWKGDIGAQKIELKDMFAYSGKVSEDGNFFVCRYKKDNVEYTLRTGI